MSTRTPPRPPTTGSAPASGQAPPPGGSASAAAGAAPPGALVTPATPNADANTRATTHTDATSQARGSGGGGVDDEAVASLRTFLTDLIRAQCELLDAIAGVAMIPMAAGSNRPDSSRADSGRAGSSTSTALVATFVTPGAAGNLVGPALLARLEAAARDVATTGGERIDAVAVSRGDLLYSEAPRHALVACALAAEGRVEGGCAIVLPQKPTVEPARALREAALAARTFETYLWRAHCHAEASRRAMLANTLELVDAVQHAPDAASMAAVVCDELKRRFGCARASASLVDRAGRLVLVGVSGSDEIDRRGATALALVAAMEECATQDAEILIPIPPEFEHDPAQRRVTRAHESLSRGMSPGVAGGPGMPLRDGAIEAGGLGSAVVSLPLRVDDDIVGVITLERDSRDPFPAGSLALLRLVAQAVGPALWTRRLADRGVLAVSRDRAREALATMVGPRHTGWKVLGALVLAALLAAGLIPIPDRVIATAEVQAARSRTVVPPFSGFLAQVHVKPNDPVLVGSPLATMDVEALSLEAARQRANRDSLGTQRDDALSRGELAKARVLGAQIAEAQAGLDQLQDRLARSVITSPIDGVVGRGDLERLIGAPVEPTQALFEIVSDARTLTLQVDERDASRVSPGQRGRLVLKSDPSRGFGFVVVRVHPMAEAIQGRNVYTVDAELSDDDATEAIAAGVASTTTGTTTGATLDTHSALRPGVSGSARIGVGRTTTLARLLRPIVDEARLRLWW
jgi:multidrug resistance efflux pump